MNIRELLIRIGVTGAEDSERKVTRLDNKVDDLKNSFGNLGAAITAAFGVLSLSAIAHAADEMQTLEFRVSQMAQTQGDASKAFDEVAEHAINSRTSIEGYIEAYAGIGAATHELIHEQSDLIKVTDSVAQGLQLAGANTQQTTSVMMQLTQAIAVGKLQWEDMRIIMQNSDAFAVRLAKSMGMTLNEMVKATQGNGGGIGADKIVNALRDMNEEVTQTFKTMPLTISQAVTVVTGRFDLMVNRFNRASGAITTIADVIVTAMEYVEKGVDSLTEVLGGAENTVRILAVALGAAGLLGAIKALQIAFGVIFSPIGLVIAALTALYLVGQDVYTWLQGGPSLFGDMVGPVSNYRNEINGLTSSLSDLWEIAKKVLDVMSKLGDAINASMNWTENLGETLGTNKFAGWAKEQGSWLLSDLNQWRKWANDATYGAFDVNQMISDAAGGARSGNQERAQNYQRNLSFRQGYNGTDLDFSSPSVGGGSVTNLTVSIGSIDASGSESSDTDVRRAVNAGVTDAFNAPVGYNRRLGDSLNFAGGSN